MLYPLKFKPRYKERIWGGDALHTKLGKKIPKDTPIGESWELSAVDGDLSVVAKGPLAGNNIEELTEVYMGDLVGDRIYEKFGLQFPLLIKLIDAQDKLSIQVHPDDRLAAERHDSYGKTEMWYLLDCDKDAELYCGFSREVSREEYLRHVKAGTMADILERERVKPGDAFFIPAGTVHAIGKGCLIAEIQQTSDITYRIFDWIRTDDHGHARELHTDLALDAIESDRSQYGGAVCRLSLFHGRSRKCGRFARTGPLFERLFRDLSGNGRGPDPELGRRQRNLRQGRMYTGSGLHGCRHALGQRQNVGSLYPGIIPIVEQNPNTTHTTTTEIWGIKKRNNGSSTSAT